MDRKSFKSVSNVFNCFTVHVESVVFAQLVLTRVTAEDERTVATTVNVNISIVVFKNV
jgi:hypothetical protein